MLRTTVGPALTLALEHERRHWTKQQPLGYGVESRSRAQTLTRGSTPLGVRLDIRSTHHWPATARREARPFPHVDAAIQRRSGTALKPVVQHPVHDRQSMRCIDTACSTIDVTAIVCCEGARAMLRAFNPWHAQAARSAAALSGVPGDRWCLHPFDPPWPITVREQKRLENTHVKANVSAQAMTPLFPFF